MIKLIYTPAVGEPIESEWEAYASGEMLGKPYVAAYRSGTLSMFGPFVEAEGAPSLAILDRNGEPLETIDLASGTLLLPAPAE